MAVGLAPMLWAQGRKPNSTPHTEKKSGLSKAKADANAALENLDKGVHEAAGAVKQGANKVLQAVDDTVHGRKD